MGARKKRRKIHPAYPDRPIPASIEPKAEKILEALNLKFEHDVYESTELLLPQTIYLAILYPKRLDIEMQHKTIRFLESWVKEKGGISEIFTVGETHIKGRFFLPVVAHQLVHYRMIPYIELRRFLRREFEIFKDDIAVFKHFQQDDDMFDADGRPYLLTEEYLESIYKTVSYLTTRRNCVSVADISIATWNTRNRQVKRALDVLIDRKRLWKYYAKFPHFCNAYVIDKFPKEAWANKRRLRVLIEKGVAIPPDWWDPQEIADEDIVEVDFTDTDSYYAYRKRNIIRYRADMEAKSANNGTS